MRGRRNRVYREGCAHHLYLKALEGNVLFYRTEDYIFFLTLCYVLSRRHGIGLEAFCIMFNHFHAFVKPVPREVFTDFCRDLQSIFAKEYSKEYRRSGPLMMEAGYAPKSSHKSILSCLVYIFNNPVAGKITRNAPDYKWNLLAYTASANPYSEKIVKRRCSSRMRRALGVVDLSFKQGLYLNYAIQKRIFQSLTGAEKKQAVDYIVNIFYPVDKYAVIRRFESYEKAVTAMNASTGAENDLSEPWEDYSVYLRMLRATLSSKLDFCDYRFHEMGEDDQVYLRRILSRVPGCTQEHLSRFLHL